MSLLTMTLGFTSSLYSSPVEVRKWCSGRDSNPGLRLSSFLAAKGRNTWFTVGCLTWLYWAGKETSPFFYRSLNRSIHANNLLFRFKFSLFD